MKVLYSQLKKYLPDLKATPREVADAYTKIGYMLDKYFEVDYLGNKDYLLDLEVRQNRADCFGVLGLARELSAYFNIELTIPKYTKHTDKSEQLDIEVKANKAVKRVFAVKFANVEIKDSPAWLKEYLAFYDINSINNIVDLTNYIMLETGHPSHAFDFDLIETGNLVWEINPKYKQMVSLDGTTINLVEEALVVSNGQKPLAIAGIVGGKESAINDNTKNVLLEMAVYEGGLIRRNARQMREMTEASNRLEKYMDPESLPEAFMWLIDLILENANGEIVSQVYENYLQKTPEIKIKLDLDKVSQIAGIDITHSESKTYLKRLGFDILEDNNSNIVVKNATNRLDVELEEDLIEEVIRLKGYDQIPVDQLSIEITKDITPSRLNLIDKIQDHLSSNGYDEVRSWVLVDSERNQKANLGAWEEINVTNSINEEVPNLRQSITVSLIGQLETYLKNNIPDIRLFEIGKVFGKDEDSKVTDSLESYLEHYSLGIMSARDSLNDLKSIVEGLIRTLGISTITYAPAEVVPKLAHPKTIWDILTIDKGMKTRKLGVIYQSNNLETENFVLAELNINEIDTILSLNNLSSALEVTHKLVALDVNINLKQSEDLRSYMAFKLEKYQNSVWKWEFVDKYINDQDIKYTVRVYYIGLSDQEAKELHIKIF